jgi:hypothetical protein
LQLSNKCSNVSLQTARPALSPAVLTVNPHCLCVCPAGQWSCDFCDDMSRLSGFGAANRESLSELLVSFFCYW